jgi:hypothetical protein
MEIEHIAHVGDQRWAEFGPGAVGIGWDMIVMGLSLHLSGSLPVDPQRSAAWAASEDGKRFMELSGASWCEAHIASGDDEADARAKAGRTIAAYTGAPAEPAG